MTVEPAEMVATPVATDLLAPVQTIPPSLAEPEMLVRDCPQTSKPAEWRRRASAIVESLTRYFRMACRGLGMFSGCNSATRDRLGVEHRYNFLRQPAKHVKPPKWWVVHHWIGGADGAAARDLRRDRAEAAEA